MKSQVHYLLENRKKQNKELTEQDICDIAYQFQEAIIEVLAKKTIRAAIEYQAKTIGIV
jgi:tRNA A37 threonylcarbamoyltransferase TsaD